MAYAAITLAQLRTRLAAKVENKPYWVTAEADLAINESLQLWCLLTGRWRKTLLLTTGIGAYDYGLPAAMLYRTRLQWNGRAMSPTSVDDLDYARANWRRESTASGGSVPTRPISWAPLSLQHIYIWPADAAGGNTLTVDGVMATPVLANAGDFVDLGEDDLSILLGCALHILSIKKGGPWFTASLPLFVQFLEAAAAENRVITTTQMYRQFMSATARPDPRAARVTAEKIASSAQQVLAQESGS